MVSKYELVGIAERLYEINAKDRVYAYYPSEKSIQMTPETLVRLFPDAEYVERRNGVCEDYMRYTVEFAGVEFMALCTPEELEKAKEAEKGIDNSNNV